MKKAKVLLGSNVRRLRESRKWTRDILAGATGLSVQMIQKIEYGKTNPSADTLDKLASAFGEPVTSLFGVDQGGFMPATGLETKGAKAGLDQLNQSKRKKQAAQIPNVGRKTVKRSPTLETGNWKESALALLFAKLARAEPASLNAALFFLTYDVHYIRVIDAMPDDDKHLFSEALNQLKA